LKEDEILGCGAEELARADAVQVGRQAGLAARGMEVQGDADHPAGNMVGRFLGEEV